MVVQTRAALVWRLLPRLVLTATLRPLLLLVQVLVLLPMVLLVLLLVVHIQVPLVLLSPPPSAPDPMHRMPAVLIWVRALQRHCLLRLTLWQPWHQRMLGRCRRSTERGACVVTGACVRVCVWVWGWGWGV